MNHLDILKKSQEILTERGNQYGDMEENFQRIANIANQLLEVPIEPYEIALILHALKLSRIATNSQNEDHYIDGINYLAFAAELVNRKKSAQEKPEEF